MAWWNGHSYAQPRRDPGPRSNRLTIASILMYFVSLLREQDHHFATSAVQLLW